MGISVFGFEHQGRHPEFQAQAFLGGLTAADLSVDAP